MDIENDNDDQQHGSIRSSTRSVRSALLGACTTEEAQRIRRSSIRDILADDTLTPSEKRKTIQSLMDGRRRSSNGSSGSMGEMARAAAEAAEYYSSDIEGDLPHIGRSVAIGPSVVSDNSISTHSHRQQYYNDVDYQNRSISTHSQRQQQIYNEFSSPSVHNRSGSSNNNNNNHVQNRSISTHSQRLQLYGGDLSSHNTTSPSQHNRSSHSNLASRFNYEADMMEDIESNNDSDSVHSEDDDNNANINNSISNHNVANFNLNLNNNSISNHNGLLNNNTNNSISNHNSIVNTTNNNNNSISNHNSIVNNANNSSISNHNSIVNNANNNSISNHNSAFANVNANANANDNNSIHLQRRQRSSSLPLWNDNSVEAVAPLAAASSNIWDDPINVNRRMEKSRPECNHYDRNCTIIASCCGLAFGCRFCHDECPILPLPFHKRQSTQQQSQHTRVAWTENSTVSKRRQEKRPSLPLGFDEDETHHEIDRFAIREVICRLCYTRQSSKTNYCNTCQAQFGEYHCNICNLWMSNDEDPYHCSECGFCRVGGRENFRHCSDCGMCIDTQLFDDHNCKAGKYMSNCPVCQEDLFSSRDASHEMPCGHAIHWHCFRELTSYDTRCPVCKKTAETPEHMAPTWQAMAMGIALQPVPPELARVVTIICNDCEEKDDDRRWHFLGVRCVKCMSFNTTVETTTMTGREAAAYLDQLDRRRGRNAAGTGSSIGGNGGAVGVEHFQQHNNRDDDDDDDDDDEDGGDDIMDDDDM